MRAARWPLVLALFSAGCLTVPLAPEPPEARRFVAPRPGGVAMEVVPLVMGHRSAPACAPAGEASCFGGATIVYGAYLVKHPRGTFLIDAGLSARSRDELSRFSFTEREALQWDGDGTLAKALAAEGSPKIDFVVLTHAHWDHASGLQELDHPRVLVGPGEAAYVASFPKDAAPLVVPAQFAGAKLETIVFDGGPYENFPASHDLFGDGSVVFVPLPGHTPGSVGVFLSAVGGRRLFFVGDAAWSREAIRRPSHKLAPLSRLVDADAGALSGTFWRLHELALHEPQLVLVPAHDGDAAKELGAR